MIVQTSRTSVVSNADPSLTLTTPPQAGNALIVGISCFSEVDNCLIPDGGVADNQGNTYALVVEGASIVSSDTHGTRPYLFIAESIAAPTGAFTITVNPNVTPPENYQNFAWGVLEVAGLGVAVEGGHPRLLAIADRTCPGPADEGVAGVIEAFLDG